MSDKHFMVSLDQIKALAPCKDGWKKIYEAQKNTPVFPLVAACDSNTFADVAWLIRVAKLPLVPALVKAAQDCAQSVAWTRYTAATAAAAAAAAATAAYAANAADAAAANAADADAAAHAAAADDAAATAAAYAAAYAAYAAYAATGAAYATAHKQQQQLNLSFLRTRLLEWEQENER